LRSFQRIPFSVHWKNDWLRDPPEAHRACSQCVALMLYSGPDEMGKLSCKHLLRLGLRRRLGSASRRTFRQVCARCGTTAVLRLGLRRRLGTASRRTFRRRKVCARCRTTAVLRLSGRRQADRGTWCADLLGVPEALKVALDDHVVVAAIAKFRKGGVHVIEDRSRMRVGF